MQIAVRGGGGAKVDLGLQYGWFIFKNRAIMPEHGPRHANAATSQNPLVQGFQKKKNILTENMVCRGPAISLHCQVGVYLPFLPRSAYAILRSSQNREGAQYVADGALFQPA